MQPPGRLAVEVQQRSQYSLLVVGLFLVDGVIAGFDHVNCFTQVDYPVGSHLVAFGGRLIDAQAGFLIA
jgi:hypothetical protein